MTAKTWRSCMVIVEADILLDLPDRKGRYPRRFADSINSKAYADLHFYLRLQVIGKRRRHTDKVRVCGVADAKKAAFGATAGPGEATTS